MRSLRPLRAFAEVALGRQRSPQYEDGPFMVPYLRAANVKDGELDLSDVKSMSFSPNEQRIYALRPGDVLVSEGSGSLGTVRASAVWSGEINDVVCFQNTLLRLRPRSHRSPLIPVSWRGGRVTHLDLACSPALRPVQTFTISVRNVSEPFRFHSRTSLSRQELLTFLRARLLVSIK